MATLSIEYSFRVTRSWDVRPRLVLVAYSQNSELSRPSLAVLTCRPYTWLLLKLMLLH